MKVLLRQTVAPFEVRQRWETKRFAATCNRRADRADIELFARGTCVQQGAQMCSGGVITIFGLEFFLKKVLHSSFGLGTHRAPFSWGRAPQAFVPPKP